MLGFVNVVMIAEVILLARWPGLVKVKQEMGTKVLLSYRIFYELLPPINTDKT